MTAPLLNFEDDLAFESRILEGTDGRSHKFDPVGSTGVEHGAGEIDRIGNPRGHDEHTKSATVPCASWPAHLMPGSP